MFDSDKLSPNEKSSFSYTRVVANIENICNAVEKNLERKQRKKPWITEETLRKNTDRKKLKENKNRAPGKTK